MRLGLTQREVAEFIGVSRQYYDDIEKGRRRRIKGDAKLQLLSEILRLPYEVLQEKAGHLPWGREPWFQLQIDDKLRTSIRFLPAARNAFRSFESALRSVLDKAPLSDEERRKIHAALGEVRRVMGDDDAA